MHRLSDAEIVRRYRLRAAGVVGGIRIGADVAARVDRLARKLVTSRNAVLRELIVEALAAREAPE